MMNSLNEKRKRLFACTRAIVRILTHACLLTGELMVELLDMQLQTVDVFFLLLNSLEELDTLSRELSAEFEELVTGH